MPENCNLEKLTPFVSQKIWGGERLLKERKIVDGLPGFSKEGGPIGETWEISRHKDGSTMVNGRPLNKIFSEGQLPYLVKLIDTKDYLSVQVHPDDEFAKVHEDSLGKTECWLILDADPGAGIYLGLRPGVTKAKFEEALKSKERMDEYLVFYPVSRGDFFYVPAGSIHAIGTGVFLAEIQQSSGITYRVWDWNRVDHNGQSRELHIDKALQVISFEDQYNTSNTFKMKAGLLDESFDKGIQSLVEHSQFEAKIISIKNDSPFIFKVENKVRVASIMSLEGSLSCKCDGKEIKLNLYESCLIPIGEEIVLTTDKVSRCLYVY